MNYANAELIKTKDGSFSFYSNQFKQSYHSLNGAISESKYVFIQQGLLYWLNKNIIHKNIDTKEIDILEVGLGTCLNLILTINEVCNYFNKNENYSVQTINLNYTGIEAFPINPILLLQAYKELLSQNYLQYDLQNNIELINIELIGLVINSDWNKVTSKQINLENGTTVNLKLTKINSKIEEYLVNQQSSKDENICYNKPIFDIIYFDAFSKSSQEELWDFNIFKNLQELQAIQGVLVTYASNSILKRNLRELGYELQALKGALGKREMLRAIKKI